MTPSEALKKIKEMFAEQTIPAPAPVEAFADYVLKDGTKVSIDELKVGGSVKVMDANNNEVPAPVGEHILADGTTIVVDEAGKIVEISTPQGEVTEDAMMKVSEKVAKMEQELASLQGKFNSQLEKFNAKEKELSEREAKVSKSIHDLSDIVLNLINTASVEPTHKPAEKFSLVEEKKQNKIDRLLNVVQSINKN